MSFDFPSSPSIGQQYPSTPIAGVPVYIWDGEKWTRPVVTDVVRYDTAQSLTTAQQLQARQNIYAAPFDAMAYSGMQVNGGMEVSQENGAASVVAAGGGARTYVLDGWTIGYQKAGASITGQQAGGPPGIKTLEVTAATALTAPGAANLAYVRQSIEGYRVSRLGFGLSTASPVTIGFWVLATVTGTMCVVLRNNAVSRSIVSSVTINSANTFEWKTITFVGDTTGAWEVTNLIGLSLEFCLATGSNFVTATPDVWTGAYALATSSQTNFLAANGNKVNIGGVVVLPGNEAPSAARSPFIMRPYDQEMVTCRRYWQKYDNAVIDVGAVAQVFIWDISMRSNPTVSGGGAGFSVFAVYPTHMHCYQTARGFQNITLDARLL